MRRRHVSKLMLLAAIASLLAGLLFAFLPGHPDPSFRRLIGISWLATGTIWLFTWRKIRRRARAA